MKRKVISLWLLTVFIISFCFTPVMADENVKNPYVENVLADSSDAHCYTPDKSNPKWLCLGGFALLKDMDFGEKGASKVKIAIGGPAGGTSMNYVNVWLYDGDYQTVKTPELSGYLHDKDTGADIGEKIATVSTGQKTNGWYSPSYITVDLKRIITGKHSIYIASPTSVNVYSVEFIQEEFKPYGENVLATTTDKTCFTPAAQNEKWLSKGGIAAFTNVDFGEVGATKVKIGIGCSGNSLTAVRVWLYDGDLSTVEIADTSTAKSGYIHNKDTGADIGTNIATISAGQAGNGWYSPKYVTVDLNETITGIHGIYIAAADGINIYSAQFIGPEMPEVESPVYNEMSFTDTNIFTISGYTINSNNIGGWNGSSYVKLNEIDFGEEAPYSVTFKIDGDKSYNPNIYLWAFDSNVDTSGYRVSFGNVLDKNGNKVDSSLYCAAVLSNLPITTWNAETTITQKLSKSIKGKKTLFIASSSALNLRSMKFNSSNGLFVDVDLSKYDEESKKVLNDGLDMGSAMTVVGNPVLKTMNGGSRNYLSFQKNSGIKIIDEKLTNSDSMTVEMWARVKELNNEGIKHIFGISDVTSNKQIFGVYENKNDFAVLTNGKEVSDCTADMSDENKKWSHYVFTKKWDLDNSEWDCVIYVNGEKTAEFSDKAENRIEEINNVLSVANNSQFNNGFSGDIAEFRVYAKAIGQDTVKSKYEERVEDYPDYDIKVNAYSYNENEKSIIYNFSESVDVSSSNVTVFDSYGRAVSGMAKRVNETTVKVSFPYGLPSDGEYTIDFENVVVKKDKSKKYFSVLFDASASEVCLYDVIMTDGYGNKFDNLDDVYTVKFSYKSNNTGKESIITTQYANGKLADVDFHLIKDEDVLKINLHDKTDEMRIFVWDASNLYPYTEKTVLKRGDNWIPTEKGLSISGDFYDNSGNKITYFENQSEVCAKLSLSTSNPIDGLKAEIKLSDAGNDTMLDSKTVEFDVAGMAEVTLKASDFAKSDKSVITACVYKDETVYFTKQLEYGDPSKTVDILLVAGQSNAMGQYADATISIKPERGTVYYGTMGNESLSDGEIGMPGALGKTWHDETGRTVLVVKAAWGATGFSNNTNGYWNVDYDKTSPRDCYDTAKNMYKTAVESVLANSEYKIGNCVYFWLQGELENDNNYNAEQYTEPFLAMHNGFLTEFGTGESAIKCGGIIPVRARVNQGYPSNLMLTGPRIAHYNLGKTYDSLQVVSIASEYWYSDDSVASWFKKEYRNRKYEGETMPLTMADVLFTDKLHYRQQAHNEIGREAALSMLSYLNGGKYADGIKLVTPNGLCEYKNGDSIYLSGESVIPIIDPKSGKKAIFTLLDDKAATMDNFGVITPKAALQNDYTMLKVAVEGQEDMTFKIYSDMVDESINIAEIKDNKNAAYTFVSDDGLYSSVEFFNSEFKRLDLCGTVALISGWVGNPGAGEGYDYGTWDKWRALLDDGRFTVSNHTYMHPTFVNQDKSVYEYQINKGYEVLKKELPKQKILSVCAPGNAVNDTVREAVSQKHYSLRGGGTENSLPITEKSLYSVGFKTVTNETTLETMNLWVDNAIFSNKWLMEMWHGVEDEGWSPPSKANATAHFEYVAQNRDDLWIADWDDVITYTLQRLNSKITVTEKTNTKMVVEVTNSLDNTIFDSELTLNVTLPDGWENVNVSVNGDEKDFSVSNGVLTLNIPKNNATVIISL